MGNKIFNQKSNPVERNQAIHDIFDQIHPNQPHFPLVPPPKAKLTLVAVISSSGECFVDEPFWAHLLESSAYLANCPVLGSIKELSLERFHLRFMSSFPSEYLK